MINTDEANWAGQCAEDIRLFDVSSECWLWFIELASMCDHKWDTAWGQSFPILLLDPSQRRRYEHQSAPQFFRHRDILPVPLWLLRWIAGGRHKIRFWQRGDNEMKKKVWSSPLHVDYFLNPKLWLSLENTNWIAQKKTNTLDPPVEELCSPKHCVPSPCNSALGITVICMDSTLKSIPMCWWEELDVAMMLSESQQG